jgi:hypothetical protein
MFPDVSTVTEVVPFVCRLKLLAPLLMVVIVPKAVVFTVP